MKESERLQYLRQKRIESKEKQGLENARNLLQQFLIDLNKLEPELAKVISLSFAYETPPNTYDMQELPVHDIWQMRTSEDEFIVKENIKKWIEKQNSSTTLIKNDFLINTDDWLEINTVSLLRNFDFLFLKLNLLYEIMFVPASKNFINLFEFEGEVVVYKGKYESGEVQYFM